MKAADLMHPADADIHVDHNLCEAQARFDASGRNRILVLDADEVVGTLHRADLPSDREAWDRLTVHDIMTASPLPTCGAEETAQKVRALLDEHPFVLVLDEEREIVGIVERGSDTLEPSLGAEATPEETADPTGGRATLDGEGKLHVYSDKPHVRRLREPR
ncbi:CBS domain-containing protein [Marinibaculum pumilum]|uniref:CBS domain-containing protein n=1 Tax=Marinibaculum pumilum TaxID=1766165 RepID=A0ABV7L805_9PROT